MYKLPLLMKEIYRMNNSVISIFWYYIHNVHSLFCSAKFCKFPIHTSANPSLMF